MIHHVLRRTTGMWSWSLNQLRHKSWNKWLNKCCKRYVTPWFLACSWLCTQMDSWESIRSRTGELQRSVWGGRHPLRSLARASRQVMRGSNNRIWDVNVTTSHHLFVIKEDGTEARPKLKRRMIPHGNRDKDKRAKWFFNRPVPNHHIGSLHSGFPVPQHSFYRYKESRSAVRPNQEAPRNICPPSEGMEVCPWASI